MNVYSRLDASFVCNNTEHPLYAIGVNEYDDQIDVIAYARHPELERGCIGDLILTSVKGQNMETGDDAPEQKDCHNDVLLTKIRVDSNGMSEATTWKYTFFKA